MVVSMMSELSDEQVDLLFHALADATRRDIVRLTLQQELSVSELANRYPMSFAAVQKHVAVLERAALISKRQHGRERLVSGRIDTVRDVNRLLDELETFWRERLQRFGDVLAEPESAPTSPGPNNPDPTTQGAPE